ncbi:MAG: ATP-binding protein [Opitutaceae bacterium]
MPATLQLLETVVRYRADTISLVMLALVACRQGRNYAWRHGAAEDFSHRSCVKIMVLAGVGALLADWLTLLLGYPAPDSFAAILIARTAVLGGVAVAGAVLLVAAVRVALLRADLRAHADTGRQLREAKQAADDANRAKSDFLAVMSHEIRTPLNAVTGFANLLAETRLDDAQRDFVTTIINEGRRLGSLINDVLDLTKIEKGHLQLERLPFAPVESVHDVLRLLGPRAAEKNVELRFEAHIAGPLLVSGDPLRFRQVLVNLVDNAIKFTAQGSVTIFLEWAPPMGGLPHGRMSIRVRDTGIGILPEKISALFQMFTQADTSTTRRYGGTGLGLAICQRLVSLMGGRINVTSKPGEGSEFSLVLPLAPFALPEEELPAALSIPALRGAAPCILVVDDLETNRFQLAVFLKIHGFDPRFATGGAEAVRLAAANHYDAILMDLQMPEVDGYIATQRIRAWEAAGRRTPIIALTASMTKGIREKCLAAGMDEHMTKPLDVRRFRTLLGALSNAEVAPEPAR